MIEKWYCLKCDVCKDVINYLHVNSEKDAIEKERNSGTKSIALRDGTCFCCPDCYKTYKKYKGIYRRMTLNGKI